MKSQTSILSIVVCLLLCCSLLPTRLSAQYTEKDIYAYIDQYKSIAMRKMNQYGIPASITMAQGIFESACGTSRLAVVGNNHFGIKCHDWTGDTILIDDDELQECFRKYNSVEDSYNDHSLFLKNRKRYANLFTLDVMDYKAWARTLKADGYATNPKYADQLISLIERFNLAHLDTLSRQGEIFDKEIPAVAETNQPKPETKPKHHHQPKSEAKPAVKVEPKPQTPAQPQRSSGNMKVFTAGNNDFPTGNSPFTYRKVFENNHTYFVIAQKFDTYEKISKDVQVAAANLRKFNDVLDNGQPVENEVIYIEAKSKSNSNRVHTVQPGETLRYIAQRYGVQLQYILKYNTLDEKSIIHPGDQILLKH